MNRRWIKGNTFPEEKFRSNNGRSIRSFLSQPVSSISRPKMWGLLSPATSSTTWTVTNNPFTFEYLPGRFHCLQKWNLFFPLPLPLAPRRYERCPLDLWIWFRGGGRERIERGTKGLFSRQSTRDPGERIARRYSRGSRFASPETRYLLLFGLHVFDSGHCGPRGIDISPPSPA